MTFKNTLRKLIAQQEGTEAGPAAVDEDLLEEDEDASASVTDADAADHDDREDTGQVAVRAPVTPNVAQYQIPGMRSRRPTEQSLRNAATRNRLLGSDVARLGQGQRRPGVNHPASDQHHRDNGRETS